MTARLVHVTTTDVSLDWLLAPQLRAFRESGYDVWTISAPGPHVERLEAMGLRHVPVASLTRRPDPLADVRAARAISATFDALRPDIVHTHNPKPGVIGRVMARRRRIPVVVNTVHGLYAQPTDRLTRRAAVYAAEALALRCSDMELVQNIEDVAVLERLGAPPARLMHLGNGIDLERFRPTDSAHLAGCRLREAVGIDPGAIVVGMVGRLVWEKGYRELIDAAEMLRAMGRTVEFLVVGPSEPDKPGAVDEATIRRLSGLGMHLLGQRDDMESVYSAIDMLVLPSHREGFPRAAMEASAMGRPVVATDIRGCRQVVAAGVTGMLVPRFDPQALAGAIGHLASSEPTRRAMGAAGRRRARELFDQDEVIRRTLRVYRNLLLAAGRRPPRSDVINLRYRDTISLVDAAESNVPAAAAAARAIDARSSGSAIS